MGKNHIKYEVHHEPSDGVNGEHIEVLVTAGKRSIRLYLELDYRLRSSGEFKIETRAKGTTHFIQI